MSEFMENVQKPRSAFVSFGSGNRDYCHCATHGLFACGRANPTCHCLPKWDSASRQAITWADSGQVPAAPLSAHSQQVRQVVKAGSCPSPSSRHTIHHGEYRFYVLGWSDGAHYTRCDYGLDGIRARGRWMDCEDSGCHPTYGEPYR